MKKIKTMIKMLSTPSKLFGALGRNGLLNWIPDKTYLKTLYRLETGNRLNLKEPKKFTEKIQWLKLYDRVQQYVELVDKYLVKEHVSLIIGPEYIIDTIGVWDRPEQIDFNILPDQFVLKWNHDAGGSGVIICKNKKYFNQKEAVEQLKKRMNCNIYVAGREWPYRNIKRKIIAEKLITDGIHEDLIDYKFYCFNGEPKYCQVIQGRNSDETIDFYDLEWKIQPFNGLYECTEEEYPHGAPLEKPRNYDKMIRIAKKLALGTRFVRIDLYNINGMIYFGEFTLYPKSGLGKFHPVSWDLNLGDALRL